MSLLCLQLVPTSAWVGAEQGNGGVSSGWRLKLQLQVRLPNGALGRRQLLDEKLALLWRSATFASWQLLARLPPIAACE